MSNIYICPCDTSDTSKDAKPVLGVVRTGFTNIYVFIKMCIGIYIYVYQFVTLKAHMEKIMIGHGMNKVYKKKNKFTNIYVFIKMCIGIYMYIYVS